MKLARSDGSGGNLSSLRWQLVNNHLLLTLNLSGTDGLHKFVM